jgi:stage V sporulation protein SpoVS
MKVDYLTRSGAINMALGAMAFALFANGSAAAADIPTDSLKFAPGVVKAPAYETPPARGYIVANGTNIFSDHAFYGTNVTGELKRGERPEVLAKVKGWEWVLIGKQGTGVGYVATSMLAPENDVPSATSSAAAADIPVGGLKFAPGVVKASGYEKPQARSYIVANGTNIFSDHAFYGTTVTGELKRGEKPEVLAKVKGWEWVLIGKQGVGVGYVATSMLSPEDKYVP